ncbi:MAG: redoxin domain-containing protein, partial [Anaerolineales bacterium]|nr:redoxin domain-containing protein [Anaerolineales bacterium]
APPRTQDTAALCPYNIMELNQPAPDFELPDLEGKVHCLSDYLGKIVIVNFWSCECPHSERTDKAIMSMFAQHLHRAADAVQVWRAQRVVMLSIASNRGENLQAMKNAARARRLPTVLLDADCSVADLFEAQTTPHIFVMDREGILRYRGPVDDVTFRKKTPSRFFLDEAVESLLAGRLPELADSTAYGCTIVREV